LKPIESIETLDELRNYNEYIIANEETKRNILFKMILKKLITLSPFPQYNDKIAGILTDHNVFEFSEMEELLEKEELLKERIQKAIDQLETL
jgi:hypothetical protein